MACRVPCHRRSTVAVGCWETENGEAAASPNDLFRRTLVSMTVSIVSQ